MFHVADVLPSQASLHARHVTLEVCYSLIQAVSQEYVVQDSTSQMSIHV